MRIAFIAHVALTKYFPTKPVMAVLGLHGTESGTGLAGRLLCSLFTSVSLYERSILPRGYVAATESIGRPER